MGSSDKVLTIVGSVLVALLVIVGFQNFLAIWEKSHHKESSAGYDLAAADSEDAGEAGGDATSADATAAAPAVDMATLVASADAAKGQKLFKRCAACHSANKGGPAKIGPNLYGVFERDIASDPAFSGYSDALKAKEGTWTVDALSAFIASPKTAVPGTRMIFNGIKQDGKRADLLAFIKTLSD